MLHTIGAILALSAVCFDFTSYIKQISKTLRTRRSKDVSTTAYMLKIAKILCSTTSLAIFANWVGFSMEAAALIICLVTLAVISHYKPKNWRLLK
jgi:uncharacterized protein with PQ loop repeat